MRAPSVVAILTVVAVACAGTSATTTTSLPATSTSTVPVTTTTTSIAYPLHPPDEVAAPGGTWRTTVLTDLSVVGFADLGGEGFMFLSDLNDRVSAFRLSDDGWEAVRYAPTKFTDIRHVEFGPIASDGHRVVLTLNAGGSRVPDGRRARTVVIASTTDGDVYETAEVANAEFTDIATDGTHWYAIGHLPRQRRARAAWSSADGLTWAQVEVSEWDPFVDQTPSGDEPEIWGDSDRRRLAQLGTSVVAGNSMHRTDWLYCYDDPDTCRQPFAAVWLRKGQEWSRFDLPIPGPLQSEDSDGGTQIVGAHLVGGTIAVLGWSYAPRGPGEYSGRWIWHWVPDDGESLPPVSPPFDTSPPLSSYAARPPYLEPLVPGREYAIPVSDWCSGLQRLGFFAEEVWVSDDMPESIQPGWPTKRIDAPGPHGPHGDVVFGVAVPVAEDLIEYRIPGLGVVGTFHPGDQRVFC